MISEVVQGHTSLDAGSDAIQALSEALGEMPQTEAAAIGSAQPVVMSPVPQQPTLMPPMHHSETVSLNPLPPVAAAVEMPSEAPAPVPSAAPAVETLSGAVAPVQGAALPVEMSSAEAANESAGDAAARGAEGDGSAEATQPPKKRIATRKDEA
jgi:hypothetical protein